MKMWHHDGDKLPGLGAIEVRPSASVRVVVQRWHCSPYSAARVTYLSIQFFQFRTVGIVIKEHSTRVK